MKYSKRIISTSLALSLILSSNISVLAKGDNVEYPESNSKEDLIMKIKIYILITVLLIITAYAMYSFPIQKYFAEKTLKEYISTQGCSIDNIKSKKILKDYKIGGYTVYIVYKDDLNYTYEYQYFPGKKNLTDSMKCIVYNKENVDVDITNERIKYPPIN